MRVAATKQLPATTAFAERTIVAMSLITNQTEPRFLRGTTASSHAELYVISKEQDYGRQPVEKRHLRACVPVRLARVYTPKLHLMGWVGGGRGVWQPCIMYTFTYMCMYLYICVYVYMQTYTNIHAHVFSI